MASSGWNRLFAAAAASIGLAAAAAPAAPVRDPAAGRKLETATFGLG
jgi:hypothetical protein